MHTVAFDEGHVLHELKHYLPTQTPLKDFIHHNSLHAFQHLDFYTAIFKGAAIFGMQPTLPLHAYRRLYKVGRIQDNILTTVIRQHKGDTAAPLWREKLLHERYPQPYEPRIGRLRAHWKDTYSVDLDSLVQPILFRILGSYLDQGIALRHFPFEDKGLLKAMRMVESNGFTSFFKSARARALFADENTTMTQLLDLVVGDPSFYEQYLFDQQFSHKGWSGMAAAIEDQPHTVLYPKKISLRDVIVLELLLEIDALDNVFGTTWEPLCKKVHPVPMDLFAPVPKTELQEVLIIWQDAFEWSYYDEVLSGLKQLRQQKALKSNSNGHPMGRRRFQAIFCIDERECSLRRHLEALETNCETLGCPGFFGVPFFFQPFGGKFYEKLAPAPVTPKHLIKEYDVAHSEHGTELLYSKKSHTFIQGFLLSLLLGIVAMVKLFLTLFRPKMSPAISDAFAHMHLSGKLQVEAAEPPQQENGLQLGFTVAEMATQVEGLLRGIGLIEDFAPLVYVVAHGSSSANNPHHGAHDCGACSGRPGATNARAFAHMANHPAVRKVLANKGLVIPDDTQFVGCMHDTAADVMAYYDEEMLTVTNAAEHRRIHDTFEEALDWNAKERSRRFASINTKADIKKIRAAIQRRSVSMFEPRPELGHGTNALCFVGHRILTKGLFLDRRAFMNSYDYRTDPDGSILLNVMSPLPPVCGGINLEYYFSRVDNQKMGAGTKLPHHVIGLIGVSNSSDGDLRPGLPWQMIEVHDPIRLLILVEHYPAVILNTIRQKPELYAWFEQGWVHLLAIHPDTSLFYFLRDGQFELYTPQSTKVRTSTDMGGLIEAAKPMETNHITDATGENLPVHVLGE